ncbi:GNAT superfamily N-acetyltransferase [Pseudomonas alcaligenes]|uniref:GNAT family N-acetyltransferase n=1 Tax=Pseudomonas sp. zfem005 TaxID=3078200 RepID=UPI00161B16DE|nr:GNAT family N-acetyltransferase [Pseudomonas sp. zfem005]MBB4821134.1 GNAT superfamily N-acetyltransferase [Pseudomonas alcaligenes]MDU9412821.1 GNAT family N-acetyltransferase [Pseudomonas sp. zfem005]
MSALNSALVAKPLHQSPRGDYWIEPLEDGTHVLIRPLREEDRERERAFINRLSPEARHNRFLGEFREVAPALLNQLMDVDDKDRVALVALAHVDGELLEVGISRYAKVGELGQCEFAVTVADEWLRRGLGSILFEHLADSARRNGFRQLYSIDSASNAGMRGLARKLGLQRRRDAEDPTQVIHRLDL